MPILVVGATSQIGYFLLARLRNQRRKVVALSRTPMQAQGADIEWRQGSIRELPVMQTLEAVVSFGPMTHLAQWLAGHEHAPAPCLVATSSMSVLTKSSSTIASETSVVRQLKEGEAAIKAECSRLGMRWTLVRPTLIYGAGRDRSLTPMAHRGLKFRVFPLPAGSGLRQPVHADDLAQIVLRLLATDVAHGMTLQAGGGERLTAVEMFRRVHKALPVRTVAVPMPAWVMRGLAGVVPAVRGPVSRLATDLVADNTELHSVLDFHPRRFQLAPWMLGMGEGWAETLAASIGDTD